MIAASVLLALVVALAAASLQTNRTPALPTVMVRTLAPHAAYGHVAVVSFTAGSERRRITPLTCVRVQMAAGAGICIVEETQDRTVQHAAYTFDRRFVRHHRIALDGVPVRVRVSPNGRLAAITVYAEEESPTGERLATETIIADVSTGAVVADLREYSLDANGSAITSPIDIASVTFQPDSDRFYATLTSEANRYLVAGSVAQRALTVIRPGIANEALSADGQRLIAKRMVGDRGYWQVTVIDLETWSERALNQGPRSIDDQVDWLDNAHVTYHDVTDQGTGVWKLSIDGAAPPQLLIPDAFSPSVQR